MDLSPREQEQAEIARDLIEAAGGLEAAADITDLSTSHLQRYQSPHHRDSMPLRVIRKLEAVTHGKAGHPIVTRHLARQAGYSLLKRPTVTADGEDLLKLLGEQAKAKGVCDNKICTALADGKCDESEALDLLPDLRKSIELSSQMLAEIEAIAGRPVQ